MAEEYIEIKTENWRAHCESTEQYKNDIMLAADDYKLKTVNKRPGKLKYMPQPFEVSVRKKDGLDIGEEDDPNRDGSDAGLTELSTTIRDCWGMR